MFTTKLSPSESKERIIKLLVLIENFVFVYESEKAEHLGLFNKPIDRGIDYHDMVSSANLS